MSDDAMVEEFKIEADDLFNEAEDSLIALEKGEEFSGHFNSLFRAFHSIKGAAGMFELNELQAHMHFLENLIESKKQNESISLKLIDYLLKGIDAGKAILANEGTDFELYDPDAEGAPEPVEMLVSESKSQSQSEENNVESISKSKKESLGLVYIVDDEEDVLSLIDELVSLEGYETKTFSSAKDLLVEVTKKVPDAIISDIRMPTMTGVELMKLINKDLPSLPVILVSGFVSKEICIEALSNGVSGIIEKPFEEEHLMNQLEKAVNNFKTFKLLNQSIDLVVYQFNDFDKFLKNTVKDSVRQTFRNELTKILKQKKKLVRYFRGA